ncbi:MAG: lipoate--protein ligase [Mycoplasmataceae bacterium]|nr:lipoate--protein ligase [Mycoplasmataceae bacterium]
MKHFVSESLNPYFNLAIEEYLMKNINGDVFYLYQNNPSVIIGKNQNPYSEVNISYMKKHQIKLVRRMSGGGAVYHDLGNLNYAFILKGKSKDLYQFKKHSSPIIKALKNLNIDIAFSGRNDLLIDGKKFSGTAQYVNQGSLLHHGTIMFDVDLKAIKHVLKPNIDKLHSKGIKSISGRVTNLKPYLDDGFSLIDLKNSLINSICVTNEQLFFSVKQISEIQKIAYEKEAAINFILESKKQYEYHNVEYIPGFGTIEIYFNLVNGKFNDFEIFGEYFSKEGLTSIKAKFIGVNYNIEDVKKMINEINDFHNYFFNLSKDKLVSLIMDAK